MLTGFQAPCYVLFIPCIKPKQFDMIIYPFLQTKKLRLKEAKESSQVHTVRKIQNGYRPRPANYRTLTLSLTKICE